MWSDHLVAFVLCCPTELRLSLDTACPDDDDKTTPRSWHHLLRNGRLYCYIPPQNGTLAILRHFSSCAQSCPSIDILVTIDC